MRKPPKLTGPPMCDCGEIGTHKLSRNEYECETCRRKNRVAQEMKRLPKQDEVIGFYNLFPADLVAQFNRGYRQFCRSRGIKEWDQTFESAVYATAENGK